jgi:UvrD-like helicase C-terminal domain
VRRPRHPRPHERAPAVALRGDPALATALGPVGSPCTVLCRTNAGLFAAAVRGRDRVHLVGGVEPLARLVLGGWRLHQGEPVPEVPSLARFRSWDELVEAAEARDPEPRFLVRVVDHYGRALPGLVAELRRRAVAHPGMAERVLATAHKAKGLEWPRVRLAEDFPSLEELDGVDAAGAPRLTAEERDQELHLLYVAATRARQRLELNAAVRSCLAGRATARPGCAAKGSGRLPTLDRARTWTLGG